MSSADPTDGVELDEERVEAPGDTTSDAAEPAPSADVASDESEADAGHSHPSRWRRWLSRTPIEVPVLAFLAVLTRFAFIGDPRTIVFDEVYFREYALHYKAGTFYFDVHPPLGKLLLGLWGAIAGVDATALDKDPAVALRLLPALAGTALILVFYVLLRQLSNSRRIATLGAGLLLLDNAVLAESRLILMNSMLMLFGFGAVTLALAARKRTGRAYWWLWAGAALLAGAATATKVTGLSSLGLIGGIWLFDVIRQRPSWRPIVAQLALLAVLPFAVYTASFAVHFGLLTKSGGSFDAYMSQEFQASLEGSKFYKPDDKQSFVEKFVDLNSTMQRSQQSLNAGTHPYASEWTGWPIMKRGVYMYLAQANDGKSRYIYTLGNPAIWWGTLLGALIVALGWIARPKRFQPYRWRLLFLGVGWAANYLPFAFIERPMFLYHYFFALLFSLAFVLVGIGALLGWNGEREKPFSFASRGEAIGYWGVLSVALLGFLFFAPITYGLPLTPDGLDARMWLSSWR